MRPLTIGLTGSVGAGKSTVAEILREQGAEVVSGDELGKIAVQQSKEIIAEIRIRFGNEVFAADGTLLRRELGKRVFADPVHTKWLTSRTFPRIFDLWQQRVNETPAPVVVFDAALIFEWGIECEFDRILVVTVDPQVAASRATPLSKLSPVEIRQRLEVQIPPDEKCAKADWVVHNSGSPADLRMSVLDFWNQQIQPLISQRKNV